MRPPHPKKTSGAVDPSSAPSEAVGSEVLGMVGSHEPVTEVIGVENDAMGLPVNTQHMPAA